MSRLPSLVPCFAQAQASSVLGRWCASAVGAWPNLPADGPLSWVAWIYTGVGVGIALTGVLAWLGGRQPANWLWLELGLIAVAGALFVSLICPSQNTPSATAGARASKTAASRAGEGTCSWCCVTAPLASATSCPPPSCRDGAAAGPRPAGVRSHMAIVRTGLRLVRGGCGTLAAGMAAPAGVGTGSWGDGTRHGSAPCFADALGIGRFGGARRRDVHGGDHGPVCSSPVSRFLPTRRRFLPDDDAFAAGQIAGHSWFVHSARKLGRFGCHPGLASALATVLLMVTAAWLSRDVEPSAHPL